MISRLRRVRLVILSILVGGNVASATTTATNFRLKGDTVDAFFDAIDPIDPCTENLVGVLAADQIEHINASGKSSVTDANLQVTRVDICNEVITFLGFGSADGHTFRVAGNAASAQLIADVPIENAIDRQV